MDDTSTCVKCHNESAFFNGVSYECPDCDYEWGFINENDFEDYDED